MLQNTSKAHCPQVEEDSNEQAAASAKAAMAAKYSAKQVSAGKTEKGGISVISREPPVPLLC